ncbi:MAG: M28 family peptidase [Bacteroidia bacterium]
MKYSLLLSLFFVLMISRANSQSNIFTTNPVAEQVMLGNYDPAHYASSHAITDPDLISEALNREISPDSLKRYLEVLVSFDTRHSASDTLSDVEGIGAARRWVLSKFNGFRSQNENRLVTSFLQFDIDICGVGQHKNVLSILPGTDPAAPLILIEGHIDSRCEERCDTSCFAGGAEDNGSGTALVMELARVMGKFTFRNTIVFMATTGEEQGLIGAQAFLNYVLEKQIALKAVLNNDVIGGILCGETASPPGCPGPGNVDSTHVRIFSHGGYNSDDKGLARFVKLEYQEQLKPLVDVPMEIQIMSPVDRTGRGGDHIPFSNSNIAAVRFTAANEHGDASADSAYHDRQHSTRDVLGVDTDMDGILDSFYVSFRYLARNATINGVAAAMIAMGPETPDFDLTNASENVLTIKITKQKQYAQYRVGVRSETNDWDSVYTMNGLEETIPMAYPADKYFVSVASIDDKGVESLFSGERFTIGNNIGENPEKPQQEIELLQNRPNPFDESTYITVLVNRPVQYNDAHVQITDQNGRVLKRISLELHEGMNEVQYRHGDGIQGSYLYSLVVDGKVRQTKKMVFTTY